MNKMKKSAVVALAALFAAMPLAGCNGESGKSREDTLKITISDIGFGTNFIYAIADEFERMYDVDVVITPTVVAGDLISQLEADYVLDDLCMFGGVNGCWEMIRQQKFTNIDDIWNSVAETDEGTTTIAQKIIPEYADAYKMPDNHYYSMPWTVELNVLNYNKTTLDKYLGAGKWSLPRTTMELMDLAQEIKGKEQYAFTWSSKVPYWGGLEDVWTAQYDGFDTYSNYIKGYVYDETSQEYVVDTTAKTLNYKGRLRAYEMEHPFLRKDNGLTHKYATTMDFAQSQSAFVGVYYANDKKDVAFTPSGNWVYEETIEDIEYKAQDIGCMNAPIISALSEKLSYYNETVEYSNVSDANKAKYDAALCAIIDYVDGVTTTKPTEVEGLTITDADITRVQEARNIARLKDQAHAFIPYNAENPDLAKKFLKFFASDYAGQLYSSVTHGFSPYYVEYEATNSFLTAYDKSAAEIVKNASNIILEYSRTGFYISRPAVDEFFFDKNVTPASFYQENYKDKNTGTNNAGWLSRLQNAGLIKD